MRAAEDERAVGLGGDAGGKGLTSLFRSLILLLFVGGLAAFFLINPAKWLPCQIPELLLVRVNATPDLQAWLEDARRRFLANSPRVALLTPTSVACADNATATSSVYGFTYSSSVSGAGLASASLR